MRLVRPCAPSYRVSSVVNIRTQTESFVTQAPRPPGRSLISEIPAGWNILHDLSPAVL